MIHISYILRFHGVTILVAFTLYASVNFHNIIYYLHGTNCGPVKQSVRENVLS